MTIRARQLTWAILLAAIAMDVWAGPTVGFSEAKIKARLGETVAVDIVMTGFPPTEGGGVTLAFDPAVVQVVGVQMNAADWTFATRDGVIDNDNGRVEDLLFSSYSGVSGDALVATVTLQAIGTGRSRLELVESGLNPFASGGARLTVDFGDAVIGVRGGGKSR